MSAPTVGAALQPAAGRGAWLGFGNLARNEAAQWTRTRNAWVQPLVWFAVMVAPLSLPLVFMREMVAAEAGSVFEAAVQMPFQLGILALPIGAIIWLHGAILGERETGTAAWVLSKPASRTSFVLAKFAVHTLALTVVALLLPAAATYVALSLEAGAALPLRAYAAAFALLGLNLPFYAALTLMLSAVARSRGVVLAVGLVLVFGVEAALAVAPWLAHTGPWLLGRMAIVLASGGPLATPWPLLSIPLWIVAFLALAVWRVRREEF
jgi:ABC-2 type transport system permease protein